MPPNSRSTDEPPSLSRPAAAAAIIFSKAHLSKQTMSFDFRSNKKTLNFAFAQGRCDVTMALISSVAGSPAENEVLGRGPADTKMEVIATDKWRLVVEDQVLVDRPLRAPLHVVDFFSLLDEEEVNGKNRNVLSQVFNSRFLYLSDRLPSDVTRQVQRDVGEFLDDAIKMASFLGHRTMRVAVTMEMVLEINHNEYPADSLMRKEREQQGGAAAGPPTNRRADAPLIRPALGCTLCREIIHAGEDVMKLPCGHRYHMTCMKRFVGLS